MTKQRKKAGRPTLPEHVRRSRPITFRVTEELADRIEEAAKANGRSLSDEIAARLDPGESEGNWALALDLLEALRKSDQWVGGKRTEEWPYKGTEAQKTRHLLYLIVDAHTGLGLPEKLLESKRFGPTEARVAAWSMLSDRNFKRLEKEGKK